MQKQIPNTPLVYDTAKVSYSKTLYSGHRKVVGIRIDENLYKTFKPIAKRVFGSVCRPIETFMASIIAISQTEVNFGNTINVHEIKIERNLRARRRLVIDEEITVHEELNQSENNCFGCKQNFPVLTLVEFISDKRARLCEACLEKYRDRTVIRKVIMK